jgi:integrase
MAKAHRGWGQGRVGQEPGGSWFIRWREDGTRRYKGGLQSKAFAETLLAKVRGDIVREGVGLPPDPKGFPFLSDEVERWLKRRELTHRAWRDDRYRWKNHLAPAFGKLRAQDVDAGRIRAFVEAKLAEGLDPATVGHCVRLLSTFFTDLCERPRETGATSNPVRTLPRSTRRLYRPKHDPKRTPFVEKIADVRRILDALPEARGLRVAYALGALAGLRTGEVLAMAWESIDLDARRLSVHEQVRNSQLGPVKDDEARTVLIGDDLYPLLAAYKLKTGGQGRLFAPDRPGRRAGRNGAPSRYMRINTLHNALRVALDAVKPAGNPEKWYHCTRHTFASHWVMAGGSLEKLAHILGHSSTEVTKRYAHLRPDAFTDEDRARVRLPKSEGAEAENGQPTGSRAKRKRAAKVQEITS